MSDRLLARAPAALRLRTLDLRDRMLGRTDELIPPRRLDFVGHSDFAATGDEFIGHFVTLGRLTPDERVLDIGCGIGRMARPLAGFLSERGSYDGFDINPQGIAWCREHYAKYPNFRFMLADLHNSRYQPQGRQRAADFDFPYHDEAFDFALATSVWTHLLTGEAERYLHETARVLAPGGRALITFFVLDEGSRRAIDSGKATLDFRLGEADGPMAVVDPAVPEEAVAFDGGWLDETLAACGLERKDAHPGAWRGLPGLSYQDILILEKKADA